MRSRRAAWGAAAVAALSAIWALYVEGQLGFPDGHRTAYDAARGPLLVAWAALAGAGAAGLAALGAVDRPPTRLLVPPAIALLALAAAGFLAWDWIALADLERGWGG